VGTSVGALRNLFNAQDVSYSDSYANIGLV
jgi:hypothetical protein